MATASGDPSRKDRWGCSICLDVFTSPRQLPCLHSFCEHCLQDYITNKANSKVGIFQEFMCPVCRAVTSPARKDKPVEEWASLFNYNPILTDGKSKEERACDVCFSENEFHYAAKLCVVCEECMCNNCALYHKKMKMSKKHQMISVKELENNPGNRTKFAKGFGCPQHDDKDIEFYCRSHETACCGTCSFLHHKTCTEVLDLKENLSGLLKAINPCNIMQQMRKLESYFNTFMNINEENINDLESRVKTIVAKIGKLRTKLNTVLDDIEETVKLDGSRIYKEWVIRTQEQNHRCHSFVNAIRNSHTLLQTVIQDGSDTQKYLVSSKTMKQLKSYSEQIQENFERVDTIKLSIWLNSNMKAILAQDARVLVKITSQEEGKDLFTSVMRPLQERTVELSRVVDICCSSGKNPSYVGGIQFTGGDIVLADCNNKTCFLCDSSLNFITSHTFPDKPFDLCLMDDQDVVVTMPYQNKVQFLSVRDRSITDRGMVKTKHMCYGVDVVSRNAIVVSGPCSATAGSNKCYWSLIYTEGMEKLHHEFDCPFTHEAYVALDMSKLSVYISVMGGNAVYCFGLKDRIQHFVYTSDDLKYPLGVTLDSEDNVYVVGYFSNNVHKLSTSGVMLQVIASGVPESPS